MEEQSAFDILVNTLKFYGLASDTDTRLVDAIRTAWTTKVIGPGDDIDTIGIQLRDNPVFQERFPANKALAAAGKPQYSVREYLRLESDYKNALQNAGLPAGFYDQPQDFQSFIANDVSVQEVAARAELGFQAVRQAPPQVVAEFQRLYGVTEGELAAYFIDPQRMRPTFDRYEAERQARAARIAAAGTTQAGMTIGRAQAEELARAGISGETAESTFAALGDQQGLFEAQMTGEQAMTQEEVVGGAFGTNAEARRAIQNRRRRRQAEFEQGGSFATGQGTQTGLTTIG